MIMDCYWTSEAPTAVNNAINYIDPEQKSTTQALDNQFIRKKHHESTDSWFYNSSAILYLFSVCGWHYLVRGLLKLSANWIE